jgi:hypothetical protein
VGIFFLIILFVSDLRCRRKRDERDEQLQGGLKVDGINFASEKNFFLRLNLNLIKLLTC